MPRCALNAFAVVSIVAISYALPQAAGARLPRWNPFESLRIGSTTTTTTTEAPQPSDPIEERKLLKSVFNGSAFTSATQLFKIDGGVDVVIKDNLSNEISISNGSFVIASLNEPEEMIVFYVGESFYSRLDGFYFPLLPHTPVFLVNDGRPADLEKIGRVINLQAGEEHVFAIHLPEELPGGENQLRELTQLLNEHTRCAEVSYDKWAARIGETGQVIADGVRYTQGQVSYVLKSTADVIKKQAPNETRDVKVPQPISKTVEYTVAATDVANFAVNTMMDSALNVVNYAGAKAKDPVMSLFGQNTGASSGGGPSVLSQRLSAGVKAGTEVVGAVMDLKDAVISQAANESVGVTHAHWGEEMADTVGTGLRGAINVYHLQDFMSEEGLAKIVRKDLPKKAAKEFISGVIGGESNVALSANETNTILLAEKAFMYTAEGIQRDAQH